MITCLVFVLMMLTSNVCYIPIAGAPPVTSDAAGRVVQEGGTGGGTRGPASGGGR
jgi:hypothetical protein